MFYALQRFQQNTKVLVLVDYRFRRNFEITSWILSKLLKFNKVVYLDIRKVLVIWTDIDGKFAKVSSHYSDPNELFGDSARNLEGRNVTYTWRHHKGVMRSMQFDPVVRWVTETAELLQGRAQPLKNPCPISAKLFDECYTRHITSGFVDISIDSVVLNGYNRASSRTIFSNVPVIDQLIVPKGRTLPILEVFFMPYSRSVWALILGVLFTVEIISLLKPSLFKNNPMLLVVCGFEQISLHRTGIFERIVLQILVVVFVFLLNSYEIKITSLMTAKPLSKTPKTLNDLVELRINVKIDSRFNPYLAENPQIGDLVINGTIDYQDLDGVSAYNIDVNWMHYMAHVPYLDYYRRQKGYCLLQETLGSGVIGYYTAYRMPLYEHFRQSLGAFEEAGMFAHWRSEYFNSRRNPQLSSSNIVHQRWLALNQDDVILAWIALAIGFIMGGFVLSMEILGCMLLQENCKQCFLKLAVKCMEYIMSRTSKFCKIYQR
ncbi:uncharacterized protein LOC6049378 [Culex quinquefasciatus]|uniref:uncharacterized protein LOC6049378 n=1 Tax=Culex quinquefasciatus TaxID=7176 RepID=UPI0018E2C1F8|nr:uncharacterized protein LOC6049378 [Culex quinquefasciatus]